MRASEIDPDILWQRLIAMVEEVADPHLKQLLFRVLSDPEVANRLRIAPAARGMHHAFRSGLLEHTLSMATTARALARHYRLHEDMVVAGALLHDLGKIWELEIDSSIEYTDDGRLLGHLAIEVLYVDRTIAELPSFPAEHRRHLLHILLSHHGEYEFGSPRRPKTPEALLVHMADNLDSKMAGMLEAIGAGGAEDDAWSDFSRILERHIYPSPAADAGRRPEQLLIRGACLRLPGSSREGGAPSTWFAATSPAPNEVQASACRLRSFASTSPGSGKRPSSCLEKTSVPFTLTSKIPPLPRINSAAMPNSRLRSAASPAARGW